ncbi:MAG: ABC transporter substrate-binding protein [Deltaproteobacteria bacterium]|jgi:peptide/nickel transport system substrate-binding protein|nr:ABC transporter substrate-binding protein [Deltaproteobacteria bacterium]
MISVRSRWLPSLIAALSLAAMAIFPAGLEADPVKELKYGSTFEYASLDPADDFSGWFSMGIGLVESLVKLDDQMRPTPWLAESFENVDPTTWKVTVRENVTFHNGQPMTAQSVKDSLERVISLNDRAKGGLLIESITVDGRVLTIKTTQPHPTFPNVLCDPFSSIIFAGDLSPLKVYGTGVFKVDKFTPKGNANMVRFDEYWGGRAKLDKFDYVYVADSGTLTMALQSGEIDASGDIPGPSRDLFKNADYIIDSVPSSRVMFLFYNLKSPLLADDAVRRAINLSLDKATFCQVILNGSCVPATGLFPDYLPYSGSRLKAEGYDLEAAKAALEAAGYKAGSDGVRAKDGKRLSITISTYTSRVELPLLAEAVQARLQEAGFEVKLDIMESVEDRLQAGNFDAIIYSYVTTPLGDPQSILENLMRTGGAYNFGKYSDPGSDELIDKLKVEFDQNQRYELAVSVQQKALDKNAFGFIGHLNRTQITKKNVVKLSNHPSDMYGPDMDTDITQ